MAMIYISIEIDMGQTQQKEKVCVWSLQESRLELLRVLFQ